MVMLREDSVRFCLHITSQSYLDFSRSDPELDTWKRMDGNHATIGKYCFDLLKLQFWMFIYECRKFISYLRHLYIRTQLSLLASFSCFSLKRSPLTRTYT